jgi:diguanylate cyclase (GGDEF)-like protein
MRLDILTLAFSTSIVLVIETVSFFVQYRVNKAYNGLGWWLLGALCQALGFSLMLALEVPSIWYLSALANPLVFAGQLFLYVGLRRFLCLSPGLRVFIALFAAYLIAYYYFMAIDESLFARSLVVSVSWVVIASLMAFTIFRGETLSFRVSAKFTARILLIYAFCQALMTASILFLPHLVSYSDIYAWPMRLLSFILPLVGGLLWSFGFIIMVNQRLNAEILGEKERIQDLAGQLKIEKAAAELTAVTDSLTGLSNRRFLDAALTTEFARLKRSGAPLSLIMLDVDRFKDFNDHYGHLAGDECLRQLGAVLKATASRLPDIVARYGGEEFAVVMPETGERGAIILAERIRKGVEALALPREASSIPPHVTVSLGVVTVDGGGMAEPKEIIALADEALYRAKRGGRNSVQSATKIVGDQAREGEGLP